METATTPSPVIEVSRLSGALGAEVRGIDLRRPLSPELIRSLRDLWLQHQLLVFRDQSITPKNQVAFARAFGKLETYPFIKPLADQPEVIPIVKEAETRLNFGGGWHTDTSYQECPPMATLLYALDVPNAGGDTLFANMYLAYEKLSVGMRAVVDSLMGVFSATKVHGDQGFYKNADHPMEKQKNAQALAVQALHPITRTHPETGRKSLYLSVPHILKFQNFHRHDSEVLLKFLGEHAVRPEFTTRLKWEKGTLAMWDNRCVQHYALNDYQGERREMHRITLVGDKPY